MDALFDEDYSDNDVVIFIIHGIGQRQERYDAHIASMRELTRNLLEEKNIKKHINLHFVPLNWHRSLHALDSVDQRMENITLPTVPKIRVINNDYLGDLVYYFTSFHGTKIANQLIDDMNKFQIEWIKKHPNFNGKYCLFGHSLGGIIAYDILCHQSWYDKHSLQKISVGRQKTNLKKINSLKFKPKILFTAGCPTAAVMVMRGQDYETYELPNCVRYYNMFHPFDPIAYRLEPLIDESFSDIEPVIIDHWNDKKLHVYIQKTYTDLIVPYLPDLSSVKSRISDLSKMSLPMSGQSGMTVSHVSPGKIFNMACETASSLISVVSENISNLKNNHSPPPDDKFGKRKKTPIRRSSRLKKLRMGDKTELEAEKEEVSEIRTFMKSIAREELDEGDISDESITFEQPSSRPSLFHSPIYEEAPTADPFDAVDVGISNSNEKAISPEKFKTKSIQQRLDYVLQINMLENVSHEYLAGLPAHFSYWGHKDVLLFLIKSSLFE